MPTHTTTNPLRIELDGARVPLPDNARDTGELHRLFRVTCTRAREDLRGAIVCAGRTGRPLAELLDAQAAELQETVALNEGHVERHRNNPHRRDWLNQVRENLQIFRTEHDEVETAAAIARDLGDRLTITGAITDPNGWLIYLSSFIKTVLEYSDPVAVSRANRTFRDLVGEDMPDAEYRQAQSGPHNLAVLPRDKAHFISLIEELGAHCPLDTRHAPDWTLHLTPTPDGPRVDIKIAGHVWHTLGAQSEDASAPASTC